MKLPDVPWQVYALAAVVVGLLLWRARGGTAAGLGDAVGGAVVDAAGGVVGGVAQGIGDAVGVPRTDQSECDRALSEGRYWDASFACPASDYIGAVWGRSKNIFRE